MVKHRIFKPLTIFFLIFFLSLSVSPAFTEQEQETDRLLSQLNEKTEGKLRVSMHSVTGLVSYIGTDKAHALRPDSGDSPEDAVEGAKRFLSSYSRLFGLDHPAVAMTVKKTVKTSDGRHFVRLQQLYNTIPVLGAELIVQMVEPGYGVVSVTGETLLVSKRNIIPNITAKSAQENALALVSKYQDIDRSRLKASQPELYLYNPVILGMNSNKTFLVWKTEVSSTELLPVNYLVLIDADSGITALSFNQIDTARDRDVYDNNNDFNQGLPGLGPVREEGDPATGIIDIDNAYDYAGDTYNFYLDNHGRDSLDDAGMTIISTVRYCPDSFNCPFANAFWNGSQMAYGEGFAAADDVVGHELTHGVTDFSSHLYYFMQSGAINESFSDIWGEFIDLSNGSGSDTPSDRWLMGEDIPGFGAIRDMSDPTVFGDPDRMQSPLYVCGLSDNGGVHSNSGIGNKTAYLLVDGDTFNGVTVSPLSGGIGMVADLFYEANTMLMTSAGDYKNLADALRQASSDLGLSAADIQEVEDAITATELDLQPTDCPAVEAPICDSGSPSDLFFDDLENTSSGNWTHGPVSGSVDEFYYPATSNPYSYDATYATSGSNNIWGYDYYTIADFAMAMTSDVPLSSGASYMHFNHAYDFDSFGSTYYDGGVIEYSTDGGATWNDAGGLITDNGYVGTLSSSWGNPLGGSEAFSGNSNGYISSRLDLSSLAGQSVRFRFRIGADSSYDRFGWFIDDIHIYTCDGVTPADEADLSLSVTDSPDPIEVGNDLTYALDVTNNGPDTATDVTLTDTLPASVSFVSVTPSAPTCNESSGTVTCDLGSLNNGDTSTVTIVVTPATATTITNNVSVSGNETDPNSSNNSESTDTTVNPTSSSSADLSLSVTDSPDPIEVGNDLTYTLDVTNNGPDTATDVTLTDTLPASVSFVSVTPSAPTCNESSGTVTCDLGSLNNGDTSTVTIVVTPATIATITNNASVSGNETDPNSSNNTAIIDTTVTKATSSDLAVSIEDSPDPVGIGDNLTYTIDVTNNGPDAAKGVTLTDTLPTEVSFVSVIPSSPTCSESSGTVICELGSLNNGDTSTVTIVTTPTTIGKFDNNVVVKGSESDPDSTNNSASETTKALTLVEGTVKKGKIIDKDKESKDYLTIKMISCDGIGDAVEGLENKEVLIAVGTDNETPEFEKTMNGSDFTPKGKGNKIRYIYKSNSGGKHKFILIPQKDTVKLISKKIDLDGIDNDIKVLINIDDWGCISVDEWSKKEKKRATKFKL
jgi:bacillolysin